MGWPSPSSAATRRWSMWSGSISIRTTNGITKGPTIPMGHHEYRPLADMLLEMAERYGKPIFLSETGAEGSAKPSWLHYVCNEVREAMDRGAAIEGICWYPITAYPGWDNSRHAETGLLSTIIADGTPPRRQAPARGIRGAARRGSPRGADGARRGRWRPAIRLPARPANPPMAFRRTASRRAIGCGRSTGSAGC